MIVMDYALNIYQRVQDRSTYNKKILDYGKSAFKGIIIAFAVILLYVLADFIYFNNQLLFADYIDTIKTYIVGFSICLYLTLIFIFYKNLKTRKTVDFILLLSPYLLMLLITMLVARNIPRIIDFVYVFFGMIIIYFRFKENSFVYRRKYICYFFLFFTFFSYPYLYQNINFNYNKSKDEVVAVTGKFNFTIYDINENKFKLSDFKSKTVCVDMWSSTCGGCIRSMPDFEKLNIHFKNNSDYKIISLFCPMKEHETYEWFKNYIKEDFNYNIDYYYINKEDFKNLGIYQFPEFLLLNKSNSIVYRGLVTYNQSIYDNIYEKLEKINSN